VSRRSTTRNRARRQAVRNKALPPAVVQSAATPPRGYALGDLINALAGRGQVNGSFNPMPRDPLTQSPFGPLSPLTPAALDPARRDTGRPEPRISQYPVAWNIPGNDQRLIPWQVLREASRYIDILRRCIEIRKRHIRSLKWVWAVSDDTIQEAYRKDYRRGKDDIEAELRDKYWPEIARLTDFWCKPWRSNGLNFGQWTNGVIEEHLVCDAVVVYPRMTYGGDVLDLEVVAGDTIKPLLDVRGARPLPPHPAFQQILYGFPRGEWQATAEFDELGNAVVDNAYLADQLYYHRENFQPSVPAYGYSAVEQALISARLYLKRQGWMLAEYDDGSTPLTWLVPDPAAHAGEDWNPRQRREWENSLNDELAGQTAARHRIKLAPPGFKPDIMPSVDERYRPDYDLHLIKLLATHLNVTIAELGFTEAKGLGSSGYHEGQEDVQDRIGRRPDTAMLSELITDVSRRFLHSPPEIEFQFLGLESEDEAAQDQVSENRTKRGAIVLNEDRKRLGLPLYDFAEADMPMIITGRGVVFLEGASQTAVPGQLIEPQVAQPNPNGQPEGDDAAPGSDLNDTDVFAPFAAAGVPIRPQRAQQPVQKGKKGKGKPDQPGKDGITPADELDDDTLEQRGMVDRIVTQLEPDFPDWALNWIRDGSTTWEGPTAVPLDQVDYSGADSWQASHEPEKVAKFTDAIRQGKIKPSVLVRKPGQKKLVVIDGHHRALGYRNLGQPVVAWVGTVTKDSGPWDEMHSAQYRSPGNDGPSASEAGGGPSTANTKPEKVAEATAYKRWARRNPNPKRPFTFLHHDRAEQDALIKAAADPGGGGADPKAPTPPADTRWPGWTMDLAVAAWWAPRLLRSLISALGIGRLARLWRKANPAYQPGDLTPDARQWLTTQGVDLTDPLARILGSIWAEGSYIGDRAAAAVMQVPDPRTAVTVDVDWGRWKPGHPDAARQVLSADGADVGLRALLDSAGITIKSIADNRLDEVAAVLADGLEQGRTPAQIAAALRGVLDNPVWAQMVALTETARAMSASAHARYAANGIEATEWLTAMDQNVCPICLANEAAGPVPIGERFPSGDLYPPGHPRCRCALVPVVGARVLGKMFGQIFDPDEHPRGYHGWFTGTGDDDAKPGGRRRRGKPHITLQHATSRLAEWQAHHQQLAQEQRAAFINGVDRALQQAQGSSLDELARHYGIKGRSTMKAGEKRQAIREHLFGAPPAKTNEAGRGPRTPRGPRASRSSTTTVTAASTPTVPPPQTVTGSDSYWWKSLTSDTGWDNPAPVKNLILYRGSYTVEQGWAFRVDGVSYLIQVSGAEGGPGYGIGWDVGSASDAARQARLLQKFHATLPTEAVQHQQAYHWLTGRNPEDSHWAVQYNRPDFRSAFTAGDGAVYAWSKVTGLSYDSSLRHEFGHNVSTAMRERGLHAEGAAWRRATQSADAHREVFDLSMNPGLAYELQITPNVDPSANFPHGVTKYGKSSVTEDYAEATSLYLAGRIGTGRLTKDGPLQPVYFRDLFPARAAILDQTYPAVAQAQLAELARLGR